MFHPKAYEILPDLLESMMDSIIVDEEGTIIYFSDSYARDTGVAAEDVIGKYVKDVIPNTRMDVVLKTGVEESGEIFLYVPILNSTKDPKELPPHFCSRIPIRKSGDPNGEVIGAFAFTSISESKDVDRMKRQIDSIKAQGSLIESHLSEVYRPEYSQDSIKGSSQAIQDLKSTIVRVAYSDLTISITGETGTGKELIAGAIHALSPRKDKPFIKINCAAIPENLLESELFGYEPGSFTGALKNGKIGKFELANHGTLLLDEIGEMPLSLQSKLLRVLQEKEIERIGGKSPIPLDIRLICSTNRNLSELVSQGKFRQDLYYRLNVMEIKAPPLRERLDDIPELTRHFVEQTRKESYNPIYRIDPSVYPILKSYSWPGNVRELQHVIECACVLAINGIIDLDSLSFMKDRIDPPDHPVNEVKITISPSDDDHFENLTVPFNVVDTNILHKNLRQESFENEGDILKRTIEENHYNVSRSAKALGITRATLYKKLKAHGLYPFP